MQVDFWILNSFSFTVVWLFSVIVVVPRDQNMLKTLLNSSTLKFSIPLIHQCSSRVTITLCANWNPEVKIKHKHVYFCHSTHLRCKYEILRKKMCFDTEIFALNSCCFFKRKTEIFLFFQEMRFLQKCLCKNVIKIIIIDHSEYISFTQIQHKMNSIVFFFSTVPLLI